MATTLTNSTFSGTYKDDFDETKGFHRLLFNSGRALQARELTQLQTIIQAEIARFGQNIYKEGAAVNPGSPTLDNRYEFIKLNTSTNPLPATPSDLVGVELTGSVSGVKARVLEVVVASGADPATLYVKYTDTSSGTAGATPVRMSAAENLTGGGYTLTVQTTNTTSNPAIGAGIRFSNEAGDFFAQGHFVFATAQSIILSKYSTTYTGIIGFKVVQDVVTVADDTSLYDNSGATLDTTAPGADRYRIRLTLTRQEDVDSDENFVFYSYIKDGEIFEEAQPANDYNVPHEMLAIRTFEESGNYVVRPFKVTFEDDDSDTTKLIANISPGTAYVNGYRSHVKSDIKLSINKARTFETENNDVVSVDYGNYVLCNKATGKNLPEVGDIVDLRDTATYGGSTIGTAAVRYIHDDGTNIRAYLFNIQMNSGQSFRDVLSIGTSATDYLDTVQELSQTVLYEANKRDVLFPLEYSRPRAFTDISLEVGRQFTGTSNGSGQLTLTLSASGETFTNTGDWYIVDNAAAGEQTGATFAGAGTASVTISGLDNSTSYSIWTKVDKASGSIRSKTLTNTTLTGTVDSDGNGVEVLSLGQADIYQVNEIKEDSAGGADISHLFRIDNGRRPSFYDVGRLIVPNNFTPPAGTVYVDFDYFAHGGTGDFFSVNSYTGQVDYEDIPNDTLANGDVVNLRDYIDFRPTFNGSTFTDINELPETTNNVRFDASYYLPRSDIIVLGEDATIKVVEGKPSQIPKFPQVPDNTMELFRLTMKPYTLDTEDIFSRRIDHKGYTMKDIARLDERVEELRELTILNLLELDTDNILVYDSAGNDRTKSGFLVDNFVDHTAALTTDPDYHASIDPQGKIMRPEVSSNIIGMNYDSDKSTGVILKGDNVYLTFSEVDYIEQLQASGTENINPFAVVRGVGSLRLSPSSDEWKDVVYLPARQVSGGTRLIQQQSQLWNEWLWGWAGQNLADGVPGQDIQTVTGTRNVRRRTVSNRLWWLDTFSTETTTSVASVVSSEVIRDMIDDRVVNLSIIPFMRSRKVYFKAEGLRPLTRFFPFFDGTNVADWVREETFTTVADDPTEYGNLYQNATQHPEVPSTLISNSFGEIEGSFFIPATDNIKFRTGTRQFKLLDISTNDDNASLSRAEADYTAAGLLETRQQTIRSTREVTLAIDQFTTTVQTGTRLIWIDPLAQSFLVNEDTGVYITKVQIYFNSKDSTVPVQLQIRPMVNGTPTSTIVPGSVKFLPPSSVNLPASQTLAAVQAAPTTFEFDEPVYLAPGQEYAIVLLADTIEYNVYVSTTEEFILGSTERRVTRQPSLGSLFKSQNGSTWTPSQKQDLMFKIIRADFNTTGQVILENVDVPNELLITNPLSFDSGDATVTVSHPNHGFDVADDVVISGLDSATTYAGVLGTSILGTRAITAVDNTGYTFEADSAATSTTIAGGTGVIATRNIQYDVVTPFFQTLQPNGTLISYEGQFTTGSSLAGTETRWQKDTIYGPIPNRDNLFFTAPRIIGDAANETSELGSGVRSATVRLTFDTVSSFLSPVADMQRSSLFLHRNMIDKQAAATAAGFNVPLNYVAETTATGGSSLAKHLTREVTLAEDAVGLKINLSANRPDTADFVVYYRVGVEADILADIDWTEIAAQEELPSDEEPTIFREYEYLPGGEGGTLSPFTKFQLKIVMRSTNSSKVPVFRDLRVIALAD